VASREWKQGEIAMKTLLEEKKIEETIKRISQSSFTVLDFIDVFKELYPQDWKRLVKRFGQFGEKRRYTVTTYLSNRLDLYSRKPYSLLLPFTRYSEGKFKDYRKVTKEERKHFGSPWIAVFKKKEEVENE
jgi:hypothetical protein